MIRYARVALNEIVVFELKGQGRNYKSNISAIIIILLDFKCSELLLMYGFH